MNPIQSFVARCERFCELADIAMPTLSTKLFNDGKRLAQLKTGRSDIGVRRLEKANGALSALVADRWGGDLAQVGQEAHASELSLGSIGVVA